MLYKKIIILVPLLQPRYAVVTNLLKNWKICDMTLILSKKHQINNNNWSTVEIDVKRIFLPFFVAFCIFFRHIITRCFILNGRDKDTKVYNGWLYFKVNKFTWAGRKYVELNIYNYPFNNLFTLYFIHKKSCYSKPLLPFFLVSNMRMPTRWIKRVKISKNP